MIPFRTACLCFGLTVLPAVAQALDPVMPSGARQVSTRVSPLDSYAMPLAGYAGGTVPVQMFEGRIVRRTWLLQTGALTSLQILDPLRAQISASGYKIVFECQSRDCGGFDFRFATEVVPAPDMHVDIRDFRFLSATQGTGGAITLLVSRSRNASYVQMIEVRAPDDVAPVPVEDAPDDLDPDTSGADLIARLEQDGHVVLSDLDFGTGAGTLGPGPYASLRELAGFLADNPDYRIMLVGHTDTDGSLSANVALSKRRAQAVRDRLVDTYDVSGNRVLAEGTGYMAPVASNLTPDGREANRRVEAVLLPD